MNRILLLAMLCVASGSCVKLENICSDDSFEYKGLLVNAFYKVQWNVTFGLLDDYLINDTIKCNPAQFSNKTNLEETLRLKKEYNRKFAELYTEDLNGNTPEEIREKYYKILNAWGDLFRMAREESKAECVESFKVKAWSGLQLFRILDEINRYNWPPANTEANFKPEIHETIETLEKLMDKLKVSTDGQTFAFRDEVASKVYYKEIFLPKEFKFLNKSSDRIGPKMKSILKYEQFLPFNNHDHDNRDCVAFNDLPWFYKHKGKE